MGGAARTAPCVEGTPTCHPAILPPSGRQGLDPVCCLSQQELKDPRQLLCSSPERSFLWPTFVARMPFTVNFLRPLREHRTHIDADYCFLRVVYPFTGSNMCQFSAMYFGTCLQVLHDGMDAPKYLTMFL